MSIYSTRDTNVLIAGGAGFIGSWVCDALIERGYRVVAVDNFDTGNEDNIGHLRGHPQFKCVVYDIRNPDLIVHMNDPVVRGSNPYSHVMNFACPASPVAYVRDPIYTIETNVYGNNHLAQLALKNNAVMFQASTSEVYGDPETSPQPESYWGRVNPTGPRACYDEGKRCGEALLYDYVRRDALKLRVARIFNTYGPKLDANDGRVVSNFVIQALTGKPITIHGDGTQTRSFCYVTDLVRGIMALTFDTGNQPEPPVNLGNPNEIPVARLAEEIIRLAGSNNEISYIDRPVDDPSRRNPDISRAKKLLGWEPRVSLEDGLQATIEHFRNYLEREEAA